MNQGKSEQNQIKRLSEYQRKLEELKNKKMKKAGKESIVK